MPKARQEYALLRYGKMIDCGDNLKVVKEQLISLSEIGVSGRVHEEFFEETDLRITINATFRKFTESNYFSTLRNVYLCGTYFEEYVKTVM